MKSLDHLQNKQTETKKPRVFNSFLLMIGLLRYTLHNRNHTCTLCSSALLDVAKEPSVRCLQAFVSLYVCVHMHVCMHACFCSILIVCVCVHVCMYVCIYVCTCVCVFLCDSAGAWLPWSLCGGQRRTWGIWPCLR